MHIPTIENLIPMVVESTNRGERAFDIYSRTLKDRISSADGRRRPDRQPDLLRCCFWPTRTDQDIKLYIKIPGGVVYSGWPSTTPCDDQPDVATFTMGMSASMAAVLLAGGDKGKRFALPNARVMIHQGSAGFRGAVPAIEVVARETVVTDDQAYRDPGAATGQALRRSSTIPSATTTGLPGGQGVRDRRRSAGAIKGLAGLTNLVEPSENGRGKG